MSAPVDVVVPTLGRPSLRRLLDALAASAGPPPGRVLLVDDRAGRSSPLLPGGPPGRLGARVEVLAGRAAGPAAARNLGWRRATAPWVAFLDDDVVPAAAWLADLEADLAGLPPDVAGSQGRLEVPLPAGRRPTDWERNVAGLARARWATADMAYRRAALAEVGGFDERFRRAYREDADLALRVVRAGWRITRGRRTASHPVGPAGPLVSLRLQAGNADDVLLRALHGPAWRAAAGAPGGRRPRHLATTAAGLAALGLLAARDRRATGPLAAVAGLGWAAGTAELAWARIAPGPRTPAEVATMLATSLLLPAAATWCWLAGWWRLPALLADSARAPRPASRHQVEAVLFDRDGTLIADVPDNGDPDRVVPLPGAREAVGRLPAPATLPAEVAAAPEVAPDLLAAVEMPLGTARRDGRP
jgi:hypothetical protein